MTPIRLYNIEFFLLYASRLTNGWDRQRFNYNIGMAYYALVYIYRIRNGECLNEWARGVVEYWGRRYFPYCVELAYRSWWEIHANDSGCCT